MEADESDNREIVYVTGHRNPDMDSVCASLCYSRLKNELDPSRRYLPIRGHMNEITKNQFNRLGIQAPMYVQDIRPRVADVLDHKPHCVQADDPIYRLCSIFQEHQINNVVVFGKENYHGMLMVRDITRHFLREAATLRPLYPFYVDNFPKLIEGRFIKEGRVKTFQASIALGLMKFELFQDYLLQTKRNLPLVLLSDRTAHIQLCVDINCPCIILVGVDSLDDILPLLENYTGTVYQSFLHTDETVQLLKLSMPLRHLMDPVQPPSVSPDTYFDEAKNVLIRSEFPALPVLDGGKFEGVVGRREFMQRPRKKLILMDHNEHSQTIEGIEDADVVEIIDHHRFAPDRTSLPIFIVCEPLGSTCTLVYELFRRMDVELDAETATLLLSGLLSDTVLLRSPTTTERDREIALKLGQIAGIRDLNAFGEAMFASGATITTQDPLTLITSDLKMFSEACISFGIGQCEVTTFQGVEEVKGKWLDVLERTKKQHNLQWIMILITNIIKEDSILLCTNHEAEAKLSYQKMGHGQYFCPGLLSRKIQLLPEVTRVLADEP
jgi:manganese-dependent inorganic pyrophosphatase